MRALLALIFVPSLAAAQIVLDADVPADGSEFVLLPFDVPEGTVEIEVRHDDLSDANILDWGLFDPNGFRGWGGGNTEPAVVGIDAASRSYLAGPIIAGTWTVIVGKAKIAEPPGHYHVEIDLRTAPTLAAQPERHPYSPTAALATGPRWYAGDFHVHSRESGDAQPTLDAIAELARSRGLDFVELSDHNTRSQLDFIDDAQSRFPALLFLPGVEYTTYHGHANGIGATTYVDHRLGVSGLTIQDAIARFHDQGALFSINHPVLDLGDQCIGCAWNHDVAPELIDAVEIETGGWMEVGQLFTPRAIQFWDAICATGRRAAAVGGSDDHRAGQGTDPTSSPIGDPTTMVFATELSAQAIVDAVRAGHTVVKLQGPGDPMLELSAGDAIAGDRIDVVQTTLHARVTGGMGSQVRFVRNGMRSSSVAVDSDPFETTLHVEAPYGTADDRWRAELIVGRSLRVVTSHLWLAAQSGTPPVDAGSLDAGVDAGTGAPSGGCGCSAAMPGRGSLLVLALLFVFRRRTG